MNSMTRTGRSAALLLISAVTVLGNFAQAQNVAPEGCSRITDRDRRLACYDRIFPPASRMAADPVRPSSPLSSQEITSTAPAAAAPATDAGFGLPARTPASAERGRISSRIVGELNGWAPGTRLKLANGQVWVVDESSRTAGYALRDPAVQVVEGIFGGYFLEIAGVSKTPRVKRAE